MVNQERLPFEGEDVAPQIKNKGLKISNANSKFTKAASEKNDFEQLAGDLIAQKDNRNKKTVEFGTQFISFLKDKTIDQNKSTLSRNIEKDICNKLVVLSLEINSDDTELEGMGSAAMINLLFKTVLMQRDSINELDYKVSKLEKLLSSSEKPKV